MEITTITCDWCKTIINAGFITFRLKQHSMNYHLCDDCVKEIEGRLKEIPPLWK